MPRDRRNKRRRGLGRRESARVSLCHNIYWHRGDDTDLRSGVLVGLSASGLALLTETTDTPKPGARIVPGPRPGRGGWRRPAVVTRVERLSGLLDLVAAEYPD